MGGIPSFFHHTVVIFCKMGYHILMEIYDPLIAQTMQFISRHGLLSPPGRVLVAVSGGADSMALLHLLCGMRNALCISVHAAHFEHGIRGEASLADARFVMEQCASLGVPCHMENGNVPALAASRRLSLEDAARQARYAFLDKTAAACGASYIAIAHHMEDQAETLLLHLVHGAGLAGLSGMRPKSGNRVRPLLSTKKADILSFLSRQGIPFRDDETNQDTKHARNFLRQEVFPLLRQMNPRVAEAMARTAEIAAGASDQMERAGNKRLAGRMQRTPYGAFYLRDGHAETAAMIREFARFAGISPLDAATTDALLSGKCANLPGGYTAYQTAKRLHVIGKAYQVPDMKARDILMEPCDVAARGDGRAVQVFDKAALQGAVFRYRAKGDRFSPLGGPGTQKLKEAMRAAGIDRPFRDMWPLLARGNRILWIVGIRPAQDAAVHAGSAHAVRVTYRGTLPFDMVRLE